MKRIGVFVKAVVLSSLVMAASLAHATGGSLDSSFGQGGIVISNFGSPIFVADAILQSDGKILVAISNNDSNFAVVRYLPSGAVDLGFGSGGFTQTFFGSFSLPQSMALQSDNKIVVAGIGSNNVFAVARFNPDGSLDNTFGVGGGTTAGVTGLLTSAVVLIQPDGKILVAGSQIPGCRGCSPQLVMARFNSDGGLDTTFGSQGTMTQANPMNPSMLAWTLAGNFLVQGNGIVAQFTANGNRISPMAPSAIASTSHSGPAAFLSDGRFVVAETVFEGSFRLRDTDTHVVRFTPSGSLDSTFNSPFLDFAGAGASTGDDAQAVAIQPNGQIVVGVSHFNSGFSNELFSLARLNPNGSLDTTFGSGGMVTTNVGGSEDLAAVFVQPDGKIVAVGTANNFSNVALVRYLGQ